ncbi:MAG TPA: hypothetical protein VN665_01560 [Candidatus Paceibacterota bacterium]|nr:hypothetical protein [Candidatus Paceibacterota bacterium]
MRKGSRFIGVPAASTEPYSWPKPYKQRIQEWFDQPMENKWIAAAIGIATAGTILGFTVLSWWDKHL